MNNSRQALAKLLLVAIYIVNSSSWSLAKPSEGQTGLSLRETAIKKHDNEGFRSLCITVILRGDLDDKDILFLAEGVSNWENFTHNKLSLHDQYLQAAAFQSLFRKSTSEETRLAVFRNAGFAYEYSPSFSKTLATDAEAVGGASALFGRFESWLLEHFRTQSQSAK